MFITSRLTALATICVFLFAGESNAAPTLETQLSRRVITPVDMTKAQTMFHGTSMASAPLVLAGPLKLFNHDGDLAPGSTGGGFYMAHEQIHAAQFACYSSEEAKKGPVAEVTVFKFAWTPPAGTKTLHWADCADTKSGGTLTKFIHANYGTGSAADLKWRDTLLAGISVVSGPMIMAEDKCLAADFVQYAAITPAALTHLKQGGHEVVKCATVPKRKSSTSS